MKYINSVNSIAVIEDINEIRNGLCEFLRTQPEFLCETTSDSIEGFFKICHLNMPPDVILLDIGLPGISGINGIKLIKEKYPEVNIIILTVYENEDKIFSALCEGASGYLIKTTPLNKVKDAILEVLAGGAPMSPQIARKVVSHFNVNKHIESSLTAKEKKIVAGLVDGLSYKMIARSNEISIETVRFHIKNIYKKLHVNCKAEVITKSLRGEI